MILKQEELELTCERLERANLKLHHVLDTLGALGKTFESSMAAELTRTSRDISPHKKRLSGAANVASRTGIGGLDLSPDQPHSGTRNSASSRRVTPVPASKRASVKDRSIAHSPQNGASTLPVDGEEGAEYQQAHTESEDDGDDDCLVV